MDAFASGRPFVTTDIPEVRLYPKLLHAVSTPEEAAKTLNMLISGEMKHDTKAQIEFATLQTWQHRAERLLEILPKRHAEVVRQLKSADPSVLANRH